MPVSKFEVITYCNEAIIYDVEAESEDQAYEIATDVNESLQRFLERKTNEVFQFTLVVEDVKSVTEDN